MKPAALLAIAAFAATLTAAHAGDAAEIVWSLQKVDGDWKVSDIESKTNDWKLGEFECK